MLRNRWLVGVLVATAALALLTLLLVRVQGSYAQTSGGQCIRDAADLDQGEICTSNDVRIGSFELVDGPDSCTPGEEIQIKVRAEIVGGAQERYDVGLFVAEDGGNALDRGTTCFRDYLHPISVDNGDDLDPSGGFGAFYNAEIGLADTCGDLEQGVPAVYMLNEGGWITITCRDSDGNGIADVGAVAAWTNNDGADCNSEAEALPDPNSKCRADSIDIAGLLVPEVAYIEVVKELEPSDDPGRFNLQIDGLNQAASVGDGGTTGKVEVSAGTSADPGDTHTVEETAASGTDLSDYEKSVECVLRGNGAPVVSDSGPGPITVPVEPGDDIVCTFTNVRETGSILFEKRVEGGTAQPSEWTFTVDGQSVAHGNSLVLPLDSYTVTEEGGTENNANYRLTAASGACSLQGSDIILTVTEGGGTCTVTNSRRTASLDVVKVVDDISLWNLSYSGPASDSDELGNGGHLGPDTVPTGTYVVSETPASGTDGSSYVSSGICIGATSLGTLSSDGRTISGVVIEEGQEVECTFTNVRPTASIAIVKMTLPVDIDGSFNFSSNTTPPSFSLKEGDSQQFLDLASGVTYTFAETVPAGWELEKIECLGQVDSEVTVVDSSVSVDLAPDESIVCTFTNEPVPSITVVKMADPASVVEPGETVEYTVRVTNNSVANVPVTLSKLEDDLYGDLTDAGNADIDDSTCVLNTVILRGQSYECTFEAEVTGSGGDDVVDTVEARARTASGREATASDDATVTIEEEPLPEIQVTKTADPTAVQAPGDTVEYTVKVVNTGPAGVPVTITGLDDDLYGDLTDVGNTDISDSTCVLNTVLQPGKSYQCTFEAEVSGSAGIQVTDTVTGTARSPAGQVVRDNDDAVVTITAAPPPQIKVEKTADPTVVYEPGDTVTYKIKVTNNSPAGVPLILTELDDDIYGDLALPSNPLISDSTCSLGVTIQPGYSYQCTFQATVGGLVGDVVADTVTAKAEDPTGVIVQDDDDATVTIVEEPPDTGVEGLTPPFIAGGLAFLGTALLAAGIGLRRRAGLTG